MQKEELGAAWRRCVVAAADKENARHESWKKEIESGDAVQLKKLKQVNDKIMMLEKLTEEMWLDIDYDL